MCILYSGTIHRQAANVNEIIQEGEAWSRNDTITYVQCASIWVLRISYYTQVYGSLSPAGQESTGYCPILKS